MCHRSLRPEGAGRHPVRQIPSSLRPSPATATRPLLAASRTVSPNSARFTSIAPSPVMIGRARAALLPWHAARIIPL
jgi:hypothetical protein